MIRPHTYLSPQVKVQGKQGQYQMSTKGKQVMSTSAKGQQVMSISGKGTAKKVITQLNQVPMTFPSSKTISTPKLQVVNEVESQVTSMWNMMYPDEQRPKFDATQFFQMFPGIKGADIAFYKSYYLYYKHKQPGERFLTVEAFIAYA